MIINVNNGENKRLKIPAPTLLLLKIIPNSAIIILFFLIDYKIATLNKAFSVLNCIYHLTILIPADNNRVMMMRSSCFS
ncbi:hypothetical protein AWS52_02600 [Enterobacter cloacae subsp. cloacae]|nr:hypothetical protein ASV00_03750 [Enterobacter cloacae subsp. cloacae]KVI57224.1 hypothetical protein AWS52_02600 [Enterobacter cloacae subsp. cloacae]HAS1793339.1 hypothetical protein [Enterobacter cloacae]